MFESIPVQLWMLLPLEERRILADDFNMPRTGATEVRDSEVISDGHSAQDLAHLTRERMAEYVGEPAATELSFGRLWELTVAKARSIANPPTGTVNLDREADPVPFETPNPTPNAKSTKAKKGSRAK
jgi:hypothetical protein